MEISSDTLALIFIILLFISLIAGTIYAIASKNSRKGYTPINSVTFFGATSLFQDNEQKAATEHVLEIQAGKKMQEEESGEPEEK